MNMSTATGKNGDRKQFRPCSPPPLAGSSMPSSPGHSTDFPGKALPRRLSTLRLLLGYGVQYVSYTEPHFRTTGPAGELMIAIAAWIAQQERIRLSERTLAGLKRARREGRVGGRPRLVVNRAKILRMNSDGMSTRAIAEEF